MFVYLNVKMYKRVKGNDLVSNIKLLCCHNHNDHVISCLNRCVMCISVIHCPYVVITQALITDTLMLLIIFGAPTSTINKSVPFTLPLNH